MIEFYFRQIKQQLNDAYKKGFLCTTDHNSIMISINTLERLVKKEKQIYPCEHIARDIANCKWRECVKMDCPKNKANPENR